MIVGVAFGRHTLNVVIIFLADIQLATDDRLHSSPGGSVHKMHRAKNVAMIGHGDSRHAQLFYALDKLLHVAGAVQHGVIGV